MAAVAKPALPRRRGERRASRTPGALGQRERRVVALQLRLLDGRRRSLTAQHEHYASPHGGRHVTSVPLRHKAFHGLVSLWACGRLHGYSETGDCLKQSDHANKWNGTGSGEWFVVPFERCLHTVRTLGTLLFLKCSRVRASGHPRVASATKHVAPYRGAACGPGPWYR